MIAGVITWPFLMMKPRVTKMGLFSEHRFDKPHDLFQATVHLKSRGCRLTRTGRQLQRRLDRARQAGGRDFFHSHRARCDAGKVQTMRVVELVKDQRQQHLRHAGAQRLSGGARATVVHHQRGASASIGWTSPREPTVASTMRSERAGFISVFNCVKWPTIFPCFPILPLSWSSLWYA